MNEFNQPVTSKQFVPQSLNILPELTADNTANLKLAQSLYAQMNQLHFSGQLPGCQIEFSTRLVRTAGKIWPKQHLMRLSLPYHRHHGVAELGSTILHEMIHLWLHEQGLPSGHTPLFRQKLVEVGMSNRVHALPMPARPYKYLYACPTCHEEIKTRRLINSSCGKCDKVYNPRHRFYLLQKLVTGREIG